MDLQMLPDNWGFQISIILRIAIAYALAFPIGWDREESARGAGLRTFPLVSVASCAYILIAQLALGPSEDMSRVLAGLMTGIGFIGGGAILKNSKEKVSGMSTATSIWITGAVGAAVGWGYYLIALVLTGLNFVTLRFFGSLKEVVHEE